MHMHVVPNSHCQGSVATSMEHWEANYESADGEATVLFYTLAGS